MRVAAPCLPVCIYSRGVAAGFSDWILLSFCYYQQVHDLRNTEECCLGGSCVQVHYPCRAGLSCGRGICFATRFLAPASQVMCGDKVRVHGPVVIFGTITENHQKHAVVTASWVCERQPSWPVFDTHAIILSKHSSSTNNNNHCLRVVTRRTSTNLNRQKKNLNRQKKIEWMLQRTGKCGISFAALASGASEKYSCFTASAAEVRVCSTWMCRSELLRDRE